MQPLSGLKTSSRRSRGWDRCPSAQRRSNPELDYSRLSVLPVGQSGGLADGSRWSFLPLPRTTTGKPRRMAEHPGWVPDRPDVLAGIFHVRKRTPTTRRVGARGLQDWRCALVGRVPPRGVRRGELSGLEPWADRAGSAATSLAPLCRGAGNLLRCCPEVAAGVDPV